MKTYQVYYDGYQQPNIKAVSNKMAMRIGGKYDSNTVFLRHWHQLIPDTTAAKKALNKDLIKMLERFYISF